MKHLSPSDERKLVSMAAAGKSLRHIAKEFGFHHSTCQLMLKQRGLATAGTKSPPPIKKARRVPEVEIARLKAAGLGIRPIAKKFRVCDMTIRRALKRIQAIQSLKGECSSSKILPLNEAQRIFGFVRWR